MSEHTPGPWTVIVATGSASGRYFGNYEIAEACTDREHKANARLIAAAPDLLAACEEMTGEHPAHEWREIFERADAAITKATG